MAKQTIDEAKVEAFVGKALGDASGAMTVFQAAIGDRLGLFKDLAANGPSTSAQLAKRTKTNERYVREWLGLMAAAGYLEYDGKKQAFSLPPEHAPVLAQETGPMFFGGMYAMFPGLTGIYEHLVNAFQAGGGVQQSTYPDSMYDGMDRFTASWHENLLLQEWIPAVPEVEKKLKKGIAVADVGCGRGRALIKLARQFPKSTYVGYDIFEPNIDKANMLAKEAGATDKVRFEQKDVSQGLPESYDLITTFDVIHDAIDPRGLLRVMREALNPDGSYLCLDINCSDKLEENVGPLGTLFHGFSLLYCMTTSLANGGEGLGTLGLHEPKLQELGKEAGFTTIRRLPLENPFNNLYELKA